MSNLTLILLAAGSSMRFKLGVKKQWLRVGNQPLWQFVADKYKKTGFFEKIIITSSFDDIEFMKNHCEYILIEGGKSRQESLKNSLKKVDTKYVLVSDIARPCINNELLNTLISHMGNSDCIVPYLKVNDTIVYDNKTIDREKVKRVQTPQLSLTSALKSALEQSEEFTDESSAIIANGGTREFILGDKDADKITHLSDLKRLSCLDSPSTDTLSGTGFDVHAFDKNAQMFLGGVKIDTDYGFLAHSDGDVAIHALVDALLGASGMGDIGMMFPDSDNAYKEMDSKKLLQAVVTKLLNFGFVIINIDVTIVAQKPKIGKYKSKMRRVLSSILNIEQIRVNIKATTTENLGFIGRCEGISVIANANLKYYDWTKI
ncbi:MAG: bifunctional 2-C-methyl-D-erythritol 4-phosphate cytidylyltransferase/2-C-methyl-D-erythritol 2,4-cyclodiphosphate synthase [Sulfurimonas sp.]|nr:bifunctional 2-C-methyl-D-erythritol 4-phosphate cytidylyltransferase/2-C-methyl-D-erythritol 2,4-cyclodiphosphate synthase [Sulfurimonas sp.]